MLHMPRAMLGDLFFDTFLQKMKSFDISRTVVYIFIGVVAVSSFLAYNYRFQMVERWGGQTYFDSSDKDAMLFLERQEQGTVMASGETNYFLPIWSGQYALYHPAESQYQGGGPDRAEKKAMTAKIYSGNATEQEFRQFLIENDVGFVFEGSRERALGSKGFDYTFLEKIYDNGARVYRVKLN